MSSAPGRRLVLASTSVRRLELLRQIGVEPDGITAPDVDETVKPGELARDVVRRLAAAKRESVAVRVSNAVVLAADTVVTCGRRILQKADDEATARRYLEFLSGRRHRVLTGVAVCSPDGDARERVVSTVVTVKRLSAAEVAWYLDSGEWQGKAGGYAIQGRFAALVKSVNGSYSNVIGLPLAETAALLEGLGYAVMRPS